MGKKLQKLRKDRAMSMYRLTQITGVSGHHIKGIEEGIRQPTIETLRKLTEALGSSLAEFFNEESENLTCLLLLPLSELSAVTVTAILILRSSCRT